MHDTASNMKKIMGAIALTPPTRSGDKQRSCTGDHDGAKKPLLVITAEVSLDTVVAEEEEAAAAGYAQAEDLDDL